MNTLPQTPSITTSNNALRVLHLVLSAMFLALSAAHAEYIHRVERLPGPIARNRVCWTTVPGRTYELDRVTPGAPVLNPSVTGVAHITADSSSECAIDPEPASPSSTYRLRIVSAPDDVTPPVLTDMRATKVAGGMVRLSVKATDACGVQNVIFSWRVPSGPGLPPLPQLRFTTAIGDTYLCNVATSSFPRGRSTTIIGKATDIQGNESQIAISFTP